MSSGELVTGDYYCLNENASYEEKQRKFSVYKEEDAATGSVTVWMRTRAVTICRTTESQMKRFSYDVKRGSVTAAALEFRTTPKCIPAC